MHYILIIILYAGAGHVAVNSIEYNNQAACTVAADEIHNSMLHDQWVHITTVCTKKEQP